MAESQVDVVFSQLSQRYSEYQSAAAQRSLLETQKVELETKISMLDQQLDTELRKIGYDGSISPMDFLNQYSSQLTAQAQALASKAGIAS